MIFRRTAYLTALMLASLSPASTIARPAGQATRQQAAPTNARPNIIYIFADDLGIGDIGPYGQEKIKTPNLDRLRAQGMLFTNFYSGSSVCAPSRASLMEGLSTAHTQIRANKELGGFADNEEFGQQPLRTATYTLPRMLQQAGYVTGGFGKWGLGVNGTTGQPTKQGWDIFFGYLDQKQAHNYFPTHLWKNEQRFPLRNPVIDVHPQYAQDQNVPLDAYKKFLGPDYSDDSITAQALQFVRDNKNRRFFLYASFIQPHVSLQIPDAEIDRFGYRTAFPEKPYEAKERGAYTPHPIPRAARAAMISRMDDDVGRLLALLDTLGLTDKTIVMFSSDNGASQAGGSDIKFFNSTMSLRGEKRDLYEGGIRAPFIARWPGRISGGSTTGVVAAGWDLMPTFAQIAGTQVRSRTDGISIVPSLIGKGKQQRHQHLYWEFFENKPAQAVRMGDWKGVRRYKTVGKGSQKTLQPLAIELYDLATDGRETRDVAQARPEVVRRIEAIMNARHRSAVPQWNFDAVGEGDSAPDAR